MFQILLLLGSLLLHEQASLAAPLVKGNCLPTCGGVTIPFPFGIGSGCFLDEWFEIFCDESTDSAVPMLKKPNLRVLNISLPDFQGEKNGMISVSLPIINSPNGTCRGNGSSTPVSLNGSHFIFSESRNVLTAVGCNIVVLLDDQKSAIIGCRPGCKDDKVVRKMTCSGSDGCCHITITPDLQAFAITFNHEKGSAKNQCEYAFLGDRSKFTRSTPDFNKLKASGHFPAVLEWGIAKSSRAASEIYKHGDSYDCSNFSFNSAYPKAMPFLQCSCRRGFTGNPYIKYGCEDVDECKGPTDPCPGRRKCVNRRGSYDCVDGSKIIKFPLLGLLLESELSSPQDNVEKSKLFNSKDLEKATDNFNEDRILGQGGQGTVYKGMLTDGKIVAIKKSKVRDKGKVEQFINEILILSQINHRNVVKLLGCCLETEVPLLVYEFIPNGTLYQYLHDPNEEFHLSWDTRLRIATEISGALFYLHSAASIPIYHRDIKSINILLDDKYRAKVADFGTSKSVSLDQTHVTTLVQGTFGYLDPEYFQSSQFTDKSDVYSFGVVLIELLTGQKPISSSREQEERNLATYFIILMEQNHLFDIVDAQVLKEGKKEEIALVANLARRCVHLNGRNRPTMKEVAMELEGIRKLQNPSGIQQNQEDRGTAESYAAVFSSSKSNIDRDAITLLDVQPLLPSATW
ncbi:hypothetical protein ACJRO7_007248 [Eucalyptus globulus]|uniref:Protein kinase domain-containing protein n=1 Tax=Eucalyptus globulus TaxID=34317 RepID=A0ABD3IMX0_EUCGL